MSAAGTSDGSNVVVREGAVEETTCKRTGKPVTIVTGHLDVGDMSAGWYTVAVTHGATDQLPLLRLYIGDWSETAGPQERWGIRMGIDRDGAHVVDWPEADITEATPIFTPLSRAQILGTPMEAQIWTLTNRILTRDSRL
ncbi:hypothetical protein [Pacificoceanicola onchidii]|uniref:hypothetical protein n=1 Tax=Pacificoceanicola onchidii TaxID=2562685 RepID=UPI0010A3D05D|nr:hypothetical protein [Pacificoceanicola onchidii]